MHVVWSPAACRRCPHCMQAARWLANSVRRHGHGHCCQVYGVRCRIVGLLYLIALSLSLARASPHLKLPVCFISLNFIQPIHQPTHGTGALPFPLACFNPTYFITSQQSAGPRAVRPLTHLSLSLSVSHSILLGASQRDQQIDHCCRLLLFFPPDGPFIQLQSYSFFLFSSTFIN